MATTGRPDGNTHGASDVVAALREAAFVRLVATPDGDAVAALGVIADALDAATTPFQATVTPCTEDADRATDADVTLALGRRSPSADATVGVDGVASRVAYGIATDLATPDAVDPTLALAGVVAGGGVPDGTPLAEAETAGLTRRPGVATPTDPVDGLAHSTLLHAPFSGDPDAAADLLADVDTAGMDGETRRRVASLVALAVGGDGDAPPRATEALERFLRPYAGGPFGTVGGYADVLDGVARTSPGLAVSLALGADSREATLEAWRDHGRRAHAAVREATTGRYDGLFVARCAGDAPVGTVARLVRDFRSPEPVVLVVADGEAAAVRTAEADIDLGATAREAAAAVDGTGGGSATRARASFDTEDTEFVVAFREAQAQ